MSAANRAVFLSYARKDTDAARRITDALRAFEVEVWFDQSELRGGDTWDTSPSSPARVEWVSPCAQAEQTLWAAQQRSGCVPALAPVVAQPDCRHSPRKTCIRAHSIHCQK